MRTKTALIHIPPTVHTTEIADLEDDLPDVETIQGGT
jgi:hypothetical protein